MDKTRTLKKNELFLRAYKKGTKAYSKCFVLYFYPNGLNSSRLGIKVSKKIAGAVGRNRIKRLVREAYRFCIADIPLFFDFVIVAKEGAKEIKSMQEALSELDYMLMKAKLI